MRWCALMIGINSTGEASGSGCVQPDPSKDRDGSKKRKPKSLRREDRPLLVISTAVGSSIDMTLTAVTSGSVLLCLFVAKRML